ncbi:MAG TPA: twin-arginine translocation pathway signal protein, partial [Thermodesulfobacteriaceae bacterium]|nr:twin-arginine translocation pathway signal protein [Thermodesulfobacteriaceae bacterium]
MKRRDFLKLSAGASLALATMDLRSRSFFRKAYAYCDTGRELPGSLGAKEVTSVCEMCFWRCPIVAKVKNGKVVKIEGNPKSPTNGRGGRARVCARGNSGVKLLYDPDRVLHPLKRKGARGEGKFVKISWDEALDEVAYNLKKVKDKYGPHAIACFDHGASAKPLRELFKAIGTENYSNEPAFFQCSGPVIVAYIYTMGYRTSGTMQYTDMANAKAMLLVSSPIGENVLVSHVMDFVDGLSKGAKLVVVDPRFSVAAGKADIWLPIRPGTDTALLLAWINYVIKHELY